MIINGEARETDVGLKCLAEDEKRPISEKEVKGS